MSAVRASAPLRVDLQVAVDGFVVPDDVDCRAWVGAALSAGGHATSGVVTVRLVNEDESAVLNSSYRDKPGPTNVLAFSGPDDTPAITHDDVVGEVELGDIVICLPICAWRIAPDRLRS